MAISAIPPELLGRLIFGPGVTTFSGSIVGTILEPYNPPDVQASDVFRFPLQPRGATDADFWIERRKRRERVLTFADMKFSYFVSP